jgi:hypothetical protein
MQRRRLLGHEHSYLMELCAAFPWRAGVDRQRMDAVREFTGKCLVDHTMAFDPALSAERLRHDMNPEMGLPARPMAGVALVPMRFIDHVEALRRKRRGKFLGNLVPHLHGI